MKKLFLGIFFVFICMTFGATTAFAVEADANSDFPYVIKEGTVYYESSYNFGSGRKGIVNEENSYTTIPCYAGINGYAFLDENGNIIDSAYIESENDIFIPESPEGAVKLFKHFKSTFYRNGWIDSNNIVINGIENTLDEESLENPTEQKPEEIFEHISNDIQQENQKTTIVIDFSGSMSDNQREVVELLKTLEFNENSTIIVFGNKYEVITPEQLISEDFYVGGGTKMIKALNEAISLRTEHLIIISDLDTHDKYDGSILEKSETLKSVIVYDPDDGSEDAIIDEMLKITWDNAIISRVRIK